MAGTKKNIVDLNSQVELDIADNTTQEVSASDEREAFLNIIYSFMNLKTPGFGVEEEGGYLTEVSITDDRSFVHKAFMDDSIATAIATIDLSEYFINGGNAFGALAELGTTDSNDLSIITNNIERIRVLDTGEILFNDPDTLLDYYIGVHSLGNDLNTYAQVWENLDSTVLGWMRDDGVFSAFGGLSTDGVASIFSDTTNWRLLLGFQAGSSQTGTDVVLLGRQIGINNTGNQIFGSGIGALLNNSGNNIFAVGNNALRNNTGSFILAFGDESGDGQTSSYSTFFQYLSGANQSGTRVFAGGVRAANANSGNYVTAFCDDAARDNTRSNLFTISNITDIFWNNVGDKGHTTLQAVTMQAAMSVDGTNTSAAASVMKWAAARGTGNASAGNNVIQYAVLQASGTTRHTLADGLTFEGNTGYIWSETSTGEKRLLSGKYVTFSADTTANEKEQDFEYTGTGGHTLTLYSASGWKGTELTIINNGSGNLTVNGGTLTAGTRIKLKSNGTNWL